MTVSTAEELMEHYGHPIEIANYGDEINYENVTVECTKCNTVLFELDNTDPQEKRQLEAAELFSEMVGKIHHQYKEWNKKYIMNSECVSIHVCWMSDDDQFFRYLDSYKAISAYLHNVEQWSHARLIMELDLNLSGDPEEKDVIFSYG